MSEMLQDRVVNIKVIGIGGAGNNVINRMIEAGDSVIGASGSLPGCMQRMWRAHAADTYNMEYGYSCMGYEISGALGVKYANPDREVYSMVGDGSFMMLHSEMVTAVQERTKINVCLFNNASFGCINNLQVGHGNKTLCTELRYRNKEGYFGDFLNIDYAKVAEGYGCKAYSIRTMEELVAAFEDSKKIKNVPVLFDIKVLPKTMTDGYGAWWNVGLASTTSVEAQKQAYENLIQSREKARKY